MHLLEDKAHFMQAQLRHFHFIIPADFLMVKFHGSRVDMIHTANGIQQGGFTAAAWSHDGDEFSFVNGKIHIAQDMILLFIYDKAFA